MTRDAIDLERAARVLLTKGNWWPAQALGSDTWVIEEFSSGRVRLPGETEWNEVDLSKIQEGTQPKLPKGTDLQFTHRRIIVSCGPFPGTDGEWLHVSISTQSRMPTYDDLVMLHKAFWGEEGWAYQVFAPVADHVNIQSYALHLWGRPAGTALLPNFGVFGTI